MMRNALLFLQWMSIVLMLLEAGYICIRLRTRIQGFLFFNVLVTLINNIGYFYMITAVNKEVYLTGLRMSYLGRVWIAFSMLVFIMGLCKVHVSKITLGVLAASNVMTYFLVMTCDKHNYYYRNMEYHTEGMFPYYISDHGIGHVVYDVTIIVTIIIGLSILIKAFLNEQNREAKRRLLIVLCAVMVECIFYTISMTVNRGGYDDAQIGYALCSLIMLFALVKYKLLDTLQLVKDYVIDDVSEGIVAVNPSGHIEYYNKPAKEIFPVIMNYESRILARLKESIETGEPFEENGRIYSPEVKPLVNNGVSAGEVYVLIDETDHYKYMKELEKQKKIAEEANESKSAFLSVVTHEIRTPMNAIVGMTNILLRESDNLSDKQEKYLRNIKSSGDSLVMIVNDILDQSKIESGKMEIIKDTYELRKVVEDVGMIIENRIGSKSVRLECELDDRIPQYIIGDGLRIRQILINLMNNAVKYTTEGFVRLSINQLEATDGRVLLKFGVKDSGQGIKSEDLKKIGQAYIQVDTVKNHSKEGTGLGLSISRDFISMMGGSLEVSSEYTKGTEFSFAIWQEVAKGPAQIEEGVQNWNGNSEIKAVGVKTLIVDDSEINLMIAEEMLSPYEMEVDTADSGEQAIEKIIENKYNIVFMDYMMPRMDGIATTEKIRALSEKYDSEDDAGMASYLRELPIIALTSDTSDATREKFIKAGINDFTDKPIVVKNLNKLMVKWIPDNLLQIR